MTKGWWKHMVLILGSIIVLAPFYMMVSYSFKSPGEIDRGEGGFFGRQEMMIDPRCVALRQPGRADIDAARERFPGEDDAGVQAALFHAPPGVQLFQSLHRSAASPLSA